MEESFKKSNSRIIKIAIVGPESTGKTTLAKTLAQLYNSTWAPEFLRDYALDKLLNENRICNEFDVSEIVKGQIQNINEATIRVNKVLFSDTSVFQTYCYSEIYFNNTSKELEELVKYSDFDYYILTNIDVPWENDLLRDQPNNRAENFSIFYNNLIKFNKNFLLVTGDVNERVIKIVHMLKEVFDLQLNKLSEQDLLFIKEKGVQIDEVLRQLSILTQGVKKVNLYRPATINDGIEFLTDVDLRIKAKYFDIFKDDYSLLKFVPASGAASRMFHFLNVFLLDFKLKEESLKQYIERSQNYAIQIFLDGIHKFPFYSEVHESLVENNPNITSCSIDEYLYEFVNTILKDKNYDFANKPKGILPFFNNQTPVDRHIEEAISYASSNNNLNIHFTISKEHYDGFKLCVERGIAKVDDDSLKVDVNFSHQSPLTETISVDVNNDIVRGDDGNIYFRQSGHGALLENLNAQNADVVFIKNIDNVSQVKANEVSLFKKALAGILIERQTQCFEYLRYLEGSELDLDYLEHIKDFAVFKLNVILPDNYNYLSVKEKKYVLVDYLNRPIRVCGMVKNQGEAGGGPFWVKDDSGKISLQIVESSQMNLLNQEQKKIFESSTHFNPVDLVCGLKDYKGNKFDLLKYRDNSAGFITEKSKDGKTLVGYELPGLWNGAMANWNTIFVEVPLFTFNPVKTVNDLLKSSYQDC